MDLGMSMKTTPLGLKTLRVTLPAMKRLAAARAMLSFAAQAYGQEGADALMAADFLFEKVAAERGEAVGVYDELLHSMMEPADATGNESVSGDDSPGQDGLEEGSSDDDGDAVYAAPDDDEEIDDDVPM